MIINDRPDRIKSSTYVIFLKIPPSTNFVSILVLRPVWQPSLQGRAGQAVQRGAELPELRRAANAGHGQDYGEVELSNLPKYRTHCYLHWLPPYVWRWHPGERDGAAEDWQRSPAVVHAKLCFEAVRRFLLHPAWCVQTCSTQRRSPLDRLTFHILYLPLNVPVS